MSTTSAGAAAATAAAGHIEGDGTVGGGRESAVPNKSHRAQQLPGLDAFAGGADGRFAGLGEGFSFFEDRFAVVTLVFV